MLELIEKLKKESVEGGELENLPCPFCKRPRSQRSTYVRCTPCATNWLQEEMHLTSNGKQYLEVNPAAARSEAARMIRSMSEAKSTVMQSTEVANAQ